MRWLIAGDGIHNLRSALDHLAYQLVLANGHTPLRQTCFPIFDSAAKYQNMDRNKVRGMSQGARDAIDAAQPYHGGNEALYTLHELDIADKHHALLTTLVSVRQGRIEIAGTLRDSKAPPFAMPNLQKPLSDGDEIFVCAPGVEHQTYLDFDLALCEPGIVNGWPLVRVLRRLVSEVESLIKSFESFL